jgi:hypothetical protein
MYRLFSYSLLANFVFYMVVVPGALAACDAITWRSYKNTQLWKIPDSQAYFYVVSHMAIDADGAPNAYHPQDKGIDFLANAGYPNGGWKSVLVPDPQNPSKPFVQPSGEFKGYFISQTTLQDRSLPVTDIRRYVNSTKVPALRELTWRNPHLVFYVERELWNDCTKYCGIRGLWITQFASRLTCLT